MEQHLAGVGANGQTFILFIVLRIKRHEKQTYLRSQWDDWRQYKKHCNFKEGDLNPCESSK